MAFYVLPFTDGISIFPFKILLLIFSSFSFTVYLDPTSLNVKCTRLAYLASTPSTRVKSVDSPHDFSICDEGQTYSIQDWDSSSAHWHHCLDSRMDAETTPPTSRSSVNAYFFRLPSTIQLGVMVDNYRPPIAA